MPTSEQLPLQRWIFGASIIYLLCFLLENFLKSVHESGYIDLGRVIPLIQQRDAFLNAIYRTFWLPVYINLWRPLRPLLAPLWWGFTIKVLLTPGVLRPGLLAFWGLAVVFSVFLLATAAVEVKWGCPGIFTGERRLGDEGTGTCARELFSGVLRVALIAATWVGWEWDAGLVERVLEWEKRRKEEWREETS